MPFSSSCRRAGCSRKVRHPDRFAFCSKLCAELYQVLGVIERTCRECNHPDTAALWTSAVEAADAITEVMRTRGRVWRESQNT